MIVQAHGKMHKVDTPGPSIAVDSHADDDEDTDACKSEQEYLVLYREVTQVMLLMSCR